MSKPPLFPKTSASGIQVDPVTLDRVIPESTRGDGSKRKTLKVRPGFTPQEDVRRFRSARQAAMDSNKLPPGHVVGWVPPPAAANAASSTAGKSKSAKKNAKRKENKEKEKQEKIKKSWDDDDDDEATENEREKGKGGEKGGEKGGNQTVASNAKDKGDASEVELADKLEKLEVQ